MPGLIKHQDYAIEYFEYGNGSKILFAFHGFNNHAEDFKILGKIWGDEYRIVAINLFFHGGSHAHSRLVDEGFSVDDLKNLFNELTSLFEAKKYTLMGYSLGGRIVLKLFEIYPEKIEKIILLAPDGIKISLFYRFLTQTSIGRKLLKRAVESASVFLRIARILKTTGMVSEKKYEFFLGNFDSKSKREKVYLVWMTLRKIISKKSSIKSLVKKYNIQFYLFFGKHDRIIQPSIGINFKKGMEDNVSMNIIDSGHRLLKEKTLFTICQIVSR
jgi:pimeloyl-ACP methyl ester carboxylesterase